MFRCMSLYIVYTIEKELYSVHMAACGWTCMHNCSINIYNRLVYRDEGKLVISYNLHTDINKKTLVYADSNDMGKCVM